MTDTALAYEATDESLDMSADIEACEELTLAEEVDLEHIVRQFYDDFASTFLFESEPDSDPNPVQIRSANWNPRAVGEQYKMAILSLIARVGFATRSLCATLLHGLGYSDSQRRATNDGLDAYVRDGLLVCVTIVGRLLGYGLTIKGAAFLNERHFRDATGHRATGHANGRSIKVGREWQHDLIAAHFLAWILFLGTDVVFERELRRRIGFKRDARIPDGLILFANGNTMLLTEKSRKTGAKAEPGANFVARANEDGVYVDRHFVTRAIFLAVRSQGVNHELRQGRLSKYLTQSLAVPMILCDAQESWRPTNLSVKTLQLVPTTEWDGFVPLKDAGLLHRERRWLREGSTVLLEYRAYFAGYALRRADGATLLGSLRIDADRTLRATVTSPGQQLWAGWRAIGDLDDYALSCTDTEFSAQVQALVWESLRQTHLWP